MTVARSDVDGAKRFLRGASRWVALLLLVQPVGPASAQSLTAGTLQGVVRSTEGGPLDGAAVTIEDLGGSTVRELTSGGYGGFALRMMLPGTYNVLVEMAGFQPVRVKGVVVAAGRTTTVAVELERRPPPITSVTEVFLSGSAAGPVGRVVMERELATSGFRPDATDLSRGLTAVAGPMDGRAGFAQAAAGLIPPMTRLFADGLPEWLLRHPGLPGEPTSPSPFPRQAIAQAQVSGGAPDAEWRGNPGSVLSLITRSGSNQIRFAPAVSFSSARVGGNAALNPADSSGTSLSFGASLSGAIKRDTARFFLQGSYQSTEMPTPFPWAQDQGSYQGAAVSVREAVQSIAQDRYSTSLVASVMPVVRTWKGGSGLARMDWRVGRNSELMVRGSAASFKETSPLLGADVGNDAGTALSGRDVSLALSFTTAGAVSNELRVGAGMSRRDWSAAVLPATRLVAEGVRVGGSAVLPGLFEAQGFTMSDALQYQHGDHLIKGGVSLDYLNHRQRYTFGSAGQFLFGDLDRFNAGTGVFARAVPAVPETKVSAPVVGLFFQDAWTLSPGLDLLLGVRYETQVLPKNRIVRTLGWTQKSGISNDSTPADRRGIQPRLGFVLDPGNRGEWIVQGGLGLYATGMDLSTFAEAVHHSGFNVKVDRVVGSVTPWPDSPSLDGAPEPGIRLTMFGGSRYRDPRTLKGDLAVTRSFPGGMTVQFSGAYHHSDYLLRRSDLNRSPSPSGEAHDGRPVWGTLLQQGGLVTVATGTSRRLVEFDLVSALSSTGYSDYYEASALISRQVGSVAFTGEYTFSRTRDNLVGLIQPDPADQLSPFPAGVNGADWDAGRSDLDIPHRAALTLELRGGGRYPMSLAARARWRSGLPFTPGFRSGVDVNGDLGGNNDPAPSEAVTSPVGPGVIASCDGSSVAGFTARNSCRERGVGSVDLRLAVPLPVGSAGGGRLLLTVDAFNLVASSTGVVDRAALLIDPTGTLTVNSGTGAVSIPYSANPQFGTLLRRGGEPRVIRVGLGMEY